MEWNFLMGPIVGAIIGYITNGIAIKMLFRPLKPITIGGYVLPYTPGVIPKEKKRLAKSIGKVVSRELLNEEVFRKALLKQEIYMRLEYKVDEYINQCQYNEATLEQLSYKFIGKKKTNILIGEAEETATSLIYAKIVNMELGKIIVERLIMALKGGALGQLLGPMSFLIKDQMIDSLGEKIEPSISQMIVSEAEGIIRQAVEEESNKLKETTVGEWAKRVEPYREAIKQLVIKGYETMVNEELAILLQRIDIATMIEERIMAFDTLEMENLILEITNKELNRLVWLGALLGGIIGIIMNLF